MSPYWHIVFDPCFSCLPVPTEGLMEWLSHSNNSTLAPSTFRSNIWPILPKTSYHALWILFKPHLSNSVLMRCFCLTLLKPIVYSEKSLTLAVIDAKYVAKKYTFEKSMHLKCQSLLTCLIGWMKPFKHGTSIVYKEHLAFCSANVGYSLTIDIVPKYSLNPHFSWVEMKSIGT